MPKHTSWVPELKHLLPPGLGFGRFCQNAKRFNESAAFNLTAKSSDGTKALKSSTPTIFVMLIPVHP